MYQREIYLPADFNHPVEWVELEGELDLFGDGRVVFFSTPGHTAGHQSMLVRLDDGRAVTGAGRGFCAGADFEYLQEVERSGSQPKRDPRPQSLPRTLRKPVIAAINGACAGLGLVMAIDVRHPLRRGGAKLTTAFARRGLIAEYGLSWVLPRVAGTSAALDLLLSGRTFLAEEAARLGVVDRVTEHERVGREAHAYALELARYSSPASMAAIKRQLYADLERGLLQSTADAVEQMERSFKRPDFRESVESFVERRPPRFPPLD